MINPQPLSDLRETRWSTIPTSPGVYWWYFPRSALDLLPGHSLLGRSLNLRQSPDSKVCLYHGLANALAQRIEWHAAQRLTPSALSSGFISTFRFTLLALNDFEYGTSEALINGYFDGLSVAWQPTSSRAEAEAIERSELEGAYRYPLNIQGNRHPELAPFVRHLKAARKTYKLRHSGRPEPTMP